MSELSSRESRYGLENHGIKNTGMVHWNLTTARLYEESLQRKETVLAACGSLVADTRPHTGRSPDDKFVVREPETEADVWWGKVNVAFDPDQFDHVHQRMIAYLQNKELFVQDLVAGADPDYRMNIRFINQHAWHNLFVRNLFRRPKADELPGMVPDFTVLQVPSMIATPEVDGTRSSTFILVNLAKRLVLIAGSHYAGEMKKSIFTACNYFLPKRDVLSMHCSANYGKDGDTALFFGLSGTGKTTLSADPSRTLIGDDEHAWSDKGIFNIEYGCYAKVIRLSREHEPQIWEATHNFGTLLENVVVDDDERRLFLDDDSLTENTRAAYTVTRIPGCDPRGLGGHPKVVIFLTCDAFGVMPPVAKLTEAQAMYHFLSGYTARVAGTERGVKEPQVIFSPCFGGPFLVHPPGLYAKMLGEKIREHDSVCYLINTGWNGGGYGVGQRMSLPVTRAIVQAALDGSLARMPYATEPYFGLHIPTDCPHVPAELLDPKRTWADKEAYHSEANKVAALFRRNFEQYADEVSDEIRAANPTGLE